MKLPSPMRSNPFCCSLLINLSMSLGFLAEEAGIVGGLFEAEVLEGLANMVEPEDWGPQQVHTDS